MVKIKILDSTNKNVESLSLDSLFAESPNAYIIKQVIDHNAFCRMLGTNKTKNLSEVSGSGKKPFKQKGTGRARQGTARSALMVGGYAAMAPRGLIREKSLNKKVKAKGLLYALISKLNDDKLVVVDSFPTSIKTKDFVSFADKFGVVKSKVLFVDDVVEYNFAKSLANVVYKNVISVEGLNVYDIIKHEYVFVSKKAMLLLQALLLKRLG